jgi:hypothetical protein
VCDTASFDGVALSPGVLDAMATKGTMIQRCRWRYGDAFRAHPFPPHRRLAGVFTTPDGRAQGWYPGDHKGCLCSVVPTFCRLPGITAAMDANPCEPPTLLGQARGVNITHIEELAGGLSGDKVELLTLADGSRAVRKTYADLATMQRERVVAELADEIGAPVARIQEVGSDHIIFDFVDGESLGRRLEFGEEIVEARGGRELGLLDYVTGNVDRHGLNVRVTNDGVVGIDHGSGSIFRDAGYMRDIQSETNRLYGGSDFAKRWVPARTNQYGEFSSVLKTKHDFTPEELDNVIRAAKTIDMPPEWLKQIEDRIGMMRR